MLRFDLLLLLVSLGHGHLLRTPPSHAPESLTERALGYDSEVVKIDAKAADHDQDFFRFVTRPDIDAPRWNIKTHNKTAVAPGYWFLGPYQDPQQKKRGGGWVGPHIYDQHGELIWSGVPMLSGFDAFDFKVSQYNGEDMLSMVYRHENGILINSQYGLEKKFDITDSVGRLNMHDFSTHHNGTTALMLKTVTKSASEKALDLAELDYSCRVRFYGFEEVNATTGDPIFSWWSDDKVGLEETVFARRPKHACHNDGGLDYIHANAVDKFPDGDYLLSGRHCNTIYKISAKDGSIVWRFRSGKNSDFEWDGHFSGQHHARVISQNSTHTVISFLDNAYVPSARPKYSADFSRGFLIALRTDVEPMKAETVAKYDHPHGDYAPGRGSYQILPNGNTYIGWTSYSLFSEYDVDGNLVLEASLKPELKSYRSYKFPWVGHPTELPAVHSVAVGTDNNQTVTTSVHVSWNGATEVAKWNLYHTTTDGDTAQLIASRPRSGFETALTWSGYASHVVAEAVDRHGKVLGTSDVVASIPPKNIYLPAVVEEDRWQFDPHGAHGSAFALPISLGTFSLAFGFGILCCAVGTLAGFLLWRWRSKMHGVTKWMRTSPAYEKVGEGENVEEDTLVEEDDDQEYRQKKSDSRKSSTSGDSEV